MRSLYLLLNDIFRDLNFLELYAKLTAVLLSIVALIIVAMIVHWITKVLTIKIIHRLVEKSKTDWDDYLLKHKVFQLFGQFFSDTGSNQSINHIYKHLLCNYFCKGSFRNPKSRKRHLPYNTLCCKSFH